MPWQIDRLRRRPAGDRLLIYLDQSARSRLAEGKHPELRAVLRKGCERGSLICPESIEHSNETVLIPAQYYSTLVDLGDELSLGIHFEDREEIWRNEVISAAAAFCGQEAPMSLANEAFSGNPHASLDEIAPFGMRVTVKSLQTDWHQDEARAQKTLALELQPFFEQTHARAPSFESDCEEAFLANIKLKLWPLVDPAEFMAWKAAAANEARQEMAAGLDASRTGSAFSRFVYRARIGEFSQHLLESFHCIRARTDEFLSSEDLRHCPIAAYESLLLTALLAVPGRKAKQGDLYDLRHLALGLSRCDIVTTDGSMKEICRSRNLVPCGVELFSSRELDDLRLHLETRLAAEE